MMVKISSSSIEEAMEASFKGDEDSDDSKKDSLNKSGAGSPEKKVVPHFKPSNKFSSKSMLQIKANAIATKNNNV